MVASLLSRKCDRNEFHIRDSSIVLDLDSYSDSMVPSNESFGEDITRDILWYFYDKFHSKTNYFLIILYVPVMALAVTANILVIAVVFKYHYMRSVTNYFVVNLSIADLLVTAICMPVAVSQAVSIIWIHGEIMCKLSSYFQGVAVAASIFTITAMSIDRYLAIRNPIAFRRVFNRKSTVLVIMALWLVALIIFAPVLRAMTLYSPGIELSNISFHGSWTMTRDFSQNISRVSRQPPVFYICSEDFKPLGIRAPFFGTVCFVLVYAIPGFIVILSYSMMGRTLCARKPPFDCDSVEGSASSQQRIRDRLPWIDTSKTLSQAQLSKYYAHQEYLLTQDSHSVFSSTPGTAVIDDVCAGCSANSTMRRGLLRNQRMLSGCGCGLPINGHHAVLALRRTATTSSGGYDSFYSRHSPHRRCYMLRSLRGRQQTEMEQMQINKNQETCYKKNEATQSHVNTLVITDEQPLLRRITSGDWYCFLSDWGALTAFVLPHAMVLFDSGSFE
ncbi:Orexin receptor type 2 [Melipona quadrifasciata]|uniref:Orexin receptor type 2 n=1 Tax=Melipona quadrifasciata TaxID=166423 RepID=A0A0M8ZPP4_9HYME|nr:Orexin receptor type 2 [Melipona quadrifasciata]